MSCLLADSQAMSDVIGRYRLVFPRLWRHTGFRALTPSSRLLALYLLTGPQTNRLGCFHFSIGTAADDLKLGAETIRKGLADVAETFAWLFDADENVIFIPSWWRWNPPQNKNVLKGNLKDLIEIPASTLVEGFARNLETLDPTLHPTFLEGCTQRLVKRSATQYQEQDPEQEHNPTRAPRAYDKRGLHAVSLPDGRLLEIARKTLRLTNPEEPLEQLLDAFHHVARTDDVHGYTTNAATKALSVALSERRTA
jgi:hypothetical protein